MDILLKMTPCPNGESATRIILNMSLSPNGEGSWFDFVLLNNLHVVIIPQLELVVDKNYCHLDFWLFGIKKKDIRRINFDILISSM